MAVQQVFCTIIFVVTILSNASAQDSTPSPRRQPKWCPVEVQEVKPYRVRSGSRTECRRACTWNRFCCEFNIIPVYTTAYRQVSRQEWKCCDDTVPCPDKTVSVDTPYKGIQLFADEYPVPPLPYEYDALEPYIDERTARVHHLGHHAGYTKKMNAALKAWRDEVGPGVGLQSNSILHILENLNQVPDKHRTAIRNNGGGFVNHAIYWATMSPQREGEPPRLPEATLATEIIANFQNFSNFQEQFTNTAKTLFGSGYVWLSRNPREQTLIIHTTANQDSPISDKLRPILVIDIWEHAYYLKHQNKRPDHIQDWWALVDWGQVKALSDWWAAYDAGHDEL
ncbi:superoxide dismutase [Mn]-like [Branchiostoma floridae x Branchiostoma japonicum]